MTGNTLGVACESRLVCGHGVVELSLRPQRGAKVVVCAQKLGLRAIAERNAVCSLGQSTLIVESQAEVEMSLPEIRLAPEGLPEGVNCVIELPVRQEGDAKLVKRIGAAPVQTSRPRGNW